MPSPFNAAVSPCSTRVFRSRTTANSSLRTVFALSRKERRWVCARVLTGRLVEAACALASAPQAQMITPWIYERPRIVMDSPDLAPGLEAPPSQSPHVASIRTAARRRASSTHTSMRLSVTMSLLLRQSPCAERRDPARIWLSTRS
jgi:hypothetical protein